MGSEQWIYRGTSLYVPFVMLFSDSYHLQETSFSGIKVIWKADVIKQKRQNRKKKKQKQAIKGHKNDRLTDATRLKLVMKNKWTRSSC